MSGTLHRDAFVSRKDTCKCTGNRLELVILYHRCYRYFVRYDTDISFAIPNYMFCLPKIYRWICFLPKLMNETRTINILDLNFIDRAVNDVIHDIWKNKREGRGGEKDRESSISYSFIIYKIVNLWYQLKL